MTEATPRKRAMRDEVRVTRQALRLVLPINRQIGAWQAAAVRLTAIASRTAASGRYNPGIEEEIETLAQNVAHQQSLLAAEMASLPEDVAGSGRLLDTARALNTTMVSIEKARAVLRQARPSAGAIPARPLSSGPMPRPHASPS
ncbi:hypothetical protein SAMN02983003_2981 [Devosia enhydra]|uniref:Uncharacterized protein n=1 Tax=Devosia enhydra TaxID=665118 RepID=A0A1K2I0G1_9HYPH|nr:hypothetical protein [Devosia enhydra]SFZ85809.1 hypothetical protein SAMN02983003_2981 [Devosia enhydra]